MRQGNENKKVFIFRYITEQTFDSYSWQLIENKQKFISQVMTGKSPVRSCEDIDESVLSYAEVKALATGNPHIKEKMVLDVEVAKLKMMKAGYSSQKYRMEDNISVNYPEKISALERKIKGYTADIRHYMQNRPADREAFSMTVGNTVYHSRKEAGTALIEMCRQAKEYEQTVIGEYMGFRMAVSQQYFSSKCLIELKISASHQSEASSDPFGIIQRMDNVLDAMPEDLEKMQRDLANVQQQLETARLEVAKPFEKEQELAEKSARLAELNFLLDMDKNEEAGQPGNAGEQGNPENCRTDSPERDRKAEGAAGRQENGMEHGMQGNRESYQETEKLSLSVAESVGFEPVRRAADMEMHRLADGGQEKMETVKQTSRQPDAQTRMQSLADAAGKHENTPQSTDGKRTSGYMQARTSVREKLAAIRARRAAEQPQNQAQMPQIKKDRAAVL